MSDDNSASNANSSNATSNDDLGLTAREINVLSEAVRCLKAPPDVDYHKLAAALGMSNPRSACNAWSIIKKKLWKDGATPGVSGRKRKATKSADTGDGEDDDDDVVDTPVKGKGKGGGGKRSAGKTAAKKGGSAKKKVKGESEDEGNGEGDAEGEGQGGGDGATTDGVVMTPQTFAAKLKRAAAASKKNKGSDSAEDEDSVVKSEDMVPTLAIGDAGVADGKVKGKKQQ